MDLVEAFRTTPVSQKIFFVQYLSVMLIILTVIAGTLSRRSISIVSPKVVITQHEIREETSLSPWSNLEELSLDLSDPTREAKLAAYRSALTQHDLVLELRVVTPDLEQGLSYVGALRDLFKEGSIPEDAIRVLVREVPTSDVVQMQERWLRAEPPPGGGGL